MRITRIILFFLFPSNLKSVKILKIMKNFDTSMLDVVSIQQKNESIKMYTHCLKILIIDIRGIRLDITSLHYVQ